ncbi:SET domain-containing protein [Fomitiporia mediterranea MF3/22]|uniref:SET domain-containing protein n=1 Tax=Fomitiporia mediterranea (strain MF3/22) TaxID=694068 RepID=UPI000440944A|nr:SET domain-containing protein [Fomitiporia mediterranea MF3/22]EJD05890.1 SET domain-containing protein [Fomitiporia mediterranea MF3/22]
MTNKQRGATNTEERQKDRWFKLIAWLQTKGFDAGQLAVEPRSREGAGRGLFTTKPLPPSKDPFLSIPASALLNSRTLRRFYPKIALEGLYDNPSSDLILTGTQLLSIHLALYRPGGEDSCSKDAHFGVYIDTLPTEFDSHPLTWLVKEKLGKAGAHEVKLLERLPPSVLSELEAVATRYWHDWDIAVRAKEKYSEELRSKNEALFNEDDFLWGWLVVNTRSLYADLFNRNLPQSNLTLCPVIDFANHTASSSVPYAVWKDRPSKVLSRPRGPSKHANDYTFLPPKQGLGQGEELLIQYGKHSNRRLFAEYGFVDENADKEADVSDLIDELIASKRAEGLIRELLPEVAQHFMSDLRIYAVPPPAHPSWGLHCVLRLINLAFPSRPPELRLTLGSAEVEDALKPWRDVTVGEAEVVSEANETSVRRDLESICKIVIARSSEGVHQLRDEDVRSEASSDNCEWYEWSEGCVVELWEEEAHVARAVMESLASGEAFL